MTRTRTTAGLSRSVLFSPSPNLDANANEVETAATVSSTASLFTAWPLPGSAKLCVEYSHARSKTCQQRSATPYAGISSRDGFHVLKRTKPCPVGAATVRAESPLRDRFAAKAAQP